jgi:hypothetical protein
VLDYEPIGRDRRTRLEGLRTGLGDPLPSHLKRLIGREFDRLELPIKQIATVERERAELLDPQTSPETASVGEVPWSAKFPGSPSVTPNWRGRAASSKSI